MLVLYNKVMRTTLTLEDHVAQGLRQKAQQENLSFKAVVNDVLRAGMAAQEMREGIVQSNSADEFENSSHVHFTQTGIPTFDSGAILIDQGMPASVALENYEDEKPL